MSINSKVGEGFQESDPEIEESVQKLIESLDQGRDREGAVSAALEILDRAISTSPRPMTPALKNRVIQTIFQEDIRPKGSAFSSERSAFKKSVGIGAKINSSSKEGAIWRVNQEVLSKVTEKCGCDLAPYLRTDEGRALLQAAQPFIQHWMDGDQIAAFLKGLEKVLPGDRIEVCSAAISLIKEEMKGGQIESCLAGISRIKEGINGAIKRAEGAFWRPPEEVEKDVQKLKKIDLSAICKIAAPLVRKRMDSQAIVKILSFVTDLPEEIKQSKVEAAGHLIKEGMGSLKVGAILDGVSLLKGDLKEEASLCRVVEPLAESLEIKEDLELIVQAAKSIPEEYREEFCKCMGPLASKVERSMLGITHVSAFLKIAYYDQNIKELFHEKKLEAACRGLSILLPSPVWTNDLCPLIEEVAKIKAEGKEEVCKIAAPFIQKGMKPKELGYVLSVIEKIKPDDRDEVLKSAAPFIQGRSGWGLAYILHVVNKIAPGEREEVFAKAKPLIQEEMKPQGVGHILSMVNSIKKEKRESVIREVRAHLPGEVDGYKLGIYLKGMEGMEVPDGGNIPAIQKGVKDYLYNRMMSLMADESKLEEVKTLYDFALRNRQSLALVEGDPLLEPLQIYRIYLGPNVKKEDNLYAIHRALLEKANAPISPSATRFKVDGKEMDFDYRVLVEKSGEKGKVSYGDLPEVSQEIFSTLFKELEERIKNSSSEERKKIEDELGGYGTLEELKGNSTASTCRVYHWLHHEKKGADEEAPWLMFEMYSIANVLQNASNKRKEGEVLSPQERLLISIPTSIANCQVGQDEGIHGVYQLLCRKDGPRYETAEEGKVQAFLKPLFKEILKRGTGRLDSYGLLMQTLAPAGGSTTQFYHQSLYVKNLLQKDLNLRHNVKIDLFPGCVDRALQSKSKEEVLRAFYEHYVEDFEKNLIPKVHEEINEGIKEMNSSDAALKKPAADLYNAVAEVLGTEHFILNEDTYEVKITREGVLLLLEKMGLFKRIPSQA